MRLFRKDHNFTWKHILLLVVEILLIYNLARLWSEYENQSNIEAMDKMMAEVPSVVSMDGKELLSESIKMMSRSKGVYSGFCHIYEQASEKEIVKYYQKEFEKNGWKYLGRYKREKPVQNVHEYERYYYFEKEGDYCMCLYFTDDDFSYDGKTKVSVYILLKRGNDGRQYCKIEED